jgi:hypothetical protein
MLLISCGWTAAAFVLCTTENRHGMSKRSGCREQGPAADRALLRKTRGVAGRKGLPGSDCAIPGTHRSGVRSTGQARGEKGFILQTGLPGRSPGPNWTPTQLRANNARQLPNRQPWQAQPSRPSPVSPAWASSLWGQQAPGLSFPRPLP